MCNVGRNMTRPDIANAVRAMARHSHDPANAHWKGVLKILTYLKNTSGRGITFSKHVGFLLIAYANSAYATNALNRRSAYGGAVIYAGGAVVCLSRTRRCHGRLRKITFIRRGRSKVVTASDWQYVRKSIRR